MRGWQANKKTHLCVASSIRAMPEAEIPPAKRVDNYFIQKSFLCALCVEHASTKRYPGCKLNPGTLTAPRSFCLVLLRSRPDTVHRFLPRKTRISTSRTRGSFDQNSPRHSITPTVADCRYRVPLTPRLHNSRF